MPDSTSPQANGYVFDTNALSLFALIHRLDILQQVATIPLYVTPAIQDELHTGLTNGVGYLADARQMIDDGELHLLTLC